MQMYQAGNENKLDQYRRLLFYCAACEGYSVDLQGWCDQYTEAFTINVLCGIYSISSTVKD